MGGVSYVAVQLLRYPAAVYSWWIDRPGVRIGLLPRVTLVVVYHGESPWDVPLTFAELVSGGDASRKDGSDALVAEDVPLPLNFGFSLVDLTRMPIETTSLNAELKAGLLALKYVKLGASVVDALPVIMRALVEARSIRKYVLALLTKYKCDRELIWRELRRAMPEEESTMLTVEEQIKEEGRLESETRGKADIVLRLLRKRFRDVPGAEERRVRQAPAAVLDRWAEQVLDAMTLQQALA